MANRKDFYQFDEIIDYYLPARGEGDTMAMQIVTALNKLIYKWFNDGDVFDNTYYLKGWCNDLSSYANWLYTYAHVTELEEIYDIKTDEDYSNLLLKLACKCFTDDFLGEYDEKGKVGSIYDADGPFTYERPQDEDEDYEDEEDDDWDEDD